MTVSCYKSCFCYIFAISHTYHSNVCEKFLPFYACLSIPAGWWRDGGLGGCRWSLLSPRGASSASPVPQINSQPASRALTSSLSLSLPLFLSPPILLCLSARGHCRPHVSFLRQLPAPYQQCMSVWQPLRLPVCCSVCPSLLLGFLLFFQSYCLSVHVPVSLPVAFSVQYSSTGKWPACQPLCQSVQLSACLFVICERLYLFACASICWFTCLPIHLFISFLTVEMKCKMANINL